jgi:hypothetical protein
MADNHDNAMAADVTRDVIRVLYLNGQTTAVYLSNAMHVIAFPVATIATTYRDE